MQPCPSNLREWLRAALRLTAIAFVVWSIVPYLIFRIVPLTEPMERMQRWRLEDGLYDELWPLFITAIILGLVLFVLAAVCHRFDRAMATKAFCLLAAALVYWVMLAPVFARAREKPVIYLYPESETIVKVALGYEGRMLFSYPPYGEEGWVVLAQPSGDFVDLKTGRTHHCLFWEGEDRVSYDMREGFIIEGKDTAAFLESALAELGLSEREANEFIVYWLPRMAPNSFILIHFATEEYAHDVPLYITPPPDTVIRVLMLFKPLQSPITVAPQQLPQIQRNGFTVVEWGGTEL